MSKLEKIVVTYTVSDGCTYSNDIVVALEAESVEDFYVNFEAWVQECIDVAEANNDCPRGTYEVGNHKFDVDYFRYEKSKPAFDRSKGRKWEVEMPEVYTLDEWFEKNKVT
jgi:hypothetical protein